VRTGGGYDVRARAERTRGNAERRRREEKTISARRGAGATKPPAARRAARDSPRTEHTRAFVGGSKGSSSRLEIHAREVLSYGRLTDNEHFGHWAHLWWSDDDADAVASALSTSSATSAPTPFPVGLTTRVSLRLRRARGSSDGGKENQNRKKFGGRVVARGADADADAGATVWGSVECSVRERRAGRPWEGPEFSIRWLSSKETKNSTKERGFSREPFRGATPRDAVDGFARALALVEPFRRGARHLASAKFLLPTAESLFGFSSSAVADTLAENASCAGRAVARLRAPHGVGLATLRVDALEREAEPREKNANKNDAPVAEWRSSFGAFPLLPGYRVTFPLCSGMAAACEVVRSSAFPAGVAFAVTVFDDGAAVKRVMGRCPDRVWAKLPNERRAVVVSGALDARLELDRTETFLGAHLFGLESPVAARMASQSENAAETKDAFLLAEPFLRDVYGAKERAKARRGAEEETAKPRDAAEYL